jgi:hypothetical protein
VDSSCTSASALKKLRSSGALISGNLLLGEHIIVSFCLSFGIPSVLEFFCLFSWFFGELY